MTITRYVREGILPAPWRNGKRGKGRWKPSDIEVALRNLAERRSHAA